MWFTCRSISSALRRVRSSAARWASRRLLLGHDRGVGHREGLLRCDDGPLGGQQLCGSDEIGDRPDRGGERRIGGAHRRQLLGGGAHGGEAVGRGLRVPQPPRPGSPGHRARRPASHVRRRTARVRPDAVPRRAHVPGRGVTAARWPAPSRGPAAARAAHRSSRRRGRHPRSRGPGGRRRRPSGTPSGPTPGRRAPDRSGQRPRPDRACRRHRHRSAGSGGRPCRRRRRGCRRGRRPGVWGGGGASDPGVREARDGPGFALPSSRRRLVRRLAAAGIVRSTPRRDRSSGPVLAVC